MKHARVVLHTHPAHVVPGRSIMLRDPLISASVCRTRGARLASRSSQCAARIAHRTARSLPLASHSSHLATHSSRRAARSTQLDHQPYYCVQPLLGSSGSRVLPPRRNSSLSFSSAMAFRPPSPPRVDLSELLGFSSLAVSGWTAAYYSTTPSDTQPQHKPKR